MDAVTYPNQKVTTYLNEQIIPLRINHEEMPYAEQFKVKWTPRIFVLDTGGEAHNDVLGFLPPQELIPFLELSRSKQLFHTDKLDEAQNLLDQLVKEDPSSSSAPEAVFLRGVCRFKKEHQVSHLKEVNRILNFDYPNSEWAQRGFPYWNL